MDCRDSFHVVLCLYCCVTGRTYSWVWSVLAYGFFIHMIPIACKITNFSLYLLYNAIIGDFCYISCIKNGCTYVSREKFKKRRPLMKPTQLFPTNAIPPLNVSRIFNVQCLQDHLQVVTNHAASCQSSSSRSLSNEPVTVREEHCNGLSSTLITHCMKQLLFIKGTTSTVIVSTSLAWPSPVHIWPHTAVMLASQWGLFHLRWYLEGEIFSTFCV